MAKYGSNSVPFLLVDGFNLLASKVFDLTVPSPEAVLEESTGMGDGWPEFLPTGLRKAEMSQSGLFDDAADGVNAAMSGSEHLSRILCVGLNGATIGAKFVGAAGVFAAKYARIASRGALHKATPTYTVNGAVDEGIVLQNLAAVTVDGNTEGANSVDHGASTANGGAGYLQVTALAGLTGYVAKIRHSADDSTYVDLITFNNVTAAPGAQRAVVAGTVNRHLAVDHNVSGSGSVTVMVGFARG